MNYKISQILNFEQRTVGIPLSFVKDAAVGVTRDNWQHDANLAEAIVVGNDMQFDFAAETAAVNDAFANAGCEIRIDEMDYREAMAEWVDMETIRGNI
jgi:hypothetical protein